jgi:hypothetical protein
VERTRRIAHAMGAAPDDAGRENRRHAGLRTSRACAAGRSPLTFIKLVLATFAKDAPEVCSGLPVIRYSVEELVQMLGASFELRETRRDMHFTPMGAIQPFTWVAGQMRPA